MLSFWTSLAEWEEISWHATCLVILFLLQHQAKSQSHSLGAEREQKGSLVQLLLETILGTGVRWTLGVKPALPLSSLVTWNK